MSTATTAMIGIATSAKNAPRKNAIERPVDPVEQHQTGGEQAQRRGYRDAAHPSPGSLDGGVAVHGHSRYLAATTLRIAAISIFNVRTGARALSQTPS